MRYPSFSEVMGSDVACIGTDLRLREVVLPMAILPYPMLVSHHQSGGGTVPSLF